MSGSVWTASVWGSAAKAAIITSALGGKLEEGEEECMICRGDIAASVSLKPCNHSVCLACVESMRASNIFKPDKGVKCPFCRSYVERYQPTFSSVNNTAVQEIVAEANRAAAVATNARIAQHTPQPPPQPPVVQAVESNWTCSHCGNQNWPSRPNCNLCKKANTYTSQKVTVKYTDVLKCSQDEILEFVKSKLHPGLNKALQDAGVPFTMNKIAGTQEGILAALKNRGEERLCKVVSVLAASGQLPECAIHFFGNYTIQDLLVATAKLRAATSASTNKFMLDGFKSQHGGLDPFGVMHSGLLSGCEEASRHQQGTYVVQKAIELGNCAETIAISTILFKSGMQLASDQKGVFVIIKALGQMVQFLTPQNAAEIQAVVEPLAAQMLKHFEKTRFLCYHQLSGKIIAEVVQAGIPAPNSLQLGLKLANLAKDFANQRAGIHLVAALLNLRPILPGSAEVMRDITCMIAMSLRGEFTRYLVNEGPKGQEVVSSCVERLADEQEVIWMDAITAELVSGGALICSDEAALEVLKFALSTNVYDPEAVGAHLDHLSALVGDVTPIAEDVFRRLQNAPPPAPPKYEAPSYVQPDVEYERDGGGVPFVVPEERAYEVKVAKVVKGKYVKEKYQKVKGKQQKAGYAGEDRPSAAPASRKAVKMVHPRSTSDSELGAVDEETSFGSLSIEDSTQSFGSEYQASSSSGLSTVQEVTPTKLHSNGQPKLSKKQYKLQQLQQQQQQQAANAPQASQVPMPVADFEPAPPLVPIHYAPVPPPPAPRPVVQPPAPAHPAAVPAAVPAKPLPAHPAAAAAAGVPAAPPAGPVAGPPGVPPIRSYQPPSMPPPYLPSSMPAPVTAPRGSYRPIPLPPHTQAQGQGQYGGPTPPSYFPMGAPPAAFTATPMPPPYLPHRPAAPPAYIPQAPAAANAPPPSWSRSPPSPAPAPCTDDAISCPPPQCGKP